MLRAGGLLAVFAFLLASMETTIDVQNPSLVLGNPEYDYEPVVAPVVAGPALQAFSAILTKTWLGFTVRRFLLMDNDVTKLRELAAQMPDVSPLHHPLRSVVLLSRTCLVHMRHARQ